MTQSEASQPVFYELGRDEIEQILARNNVGRLAFSLHDRVDIEPINYVFDGSWIYGRTSHGAKLSTIAHHPPPMIRLRSGTRCFAFTWTR